MKLIILDDTVATPPNKNQQMKLNSWFHRLEHIFPHGEMQIATVHGERASYLLQELLKACG